MFGIDATIGFLGSFGATLVLLGVVVWSGKRARLAIHLTSVAATVGALATTIAFAKALGHHYDLHAAGPITPIHLWIAKVATAAYVLPLVTGVMTLLDRKWRGVHNKVAIATLALTIVAAGTGTWMLLAAPRV